MSDALEKNLRKAMVALGHVVESLIGKARKARVQVGTRSGLQPILSMEGQLSTPRVHELIENAMQKVVGASIPNLSGQMALEVGEGPASLAAKMLANQAKIAMSVEIGGASIGRQGDVSRGFVVRAPASKMPFPDGNFSYMLARMATVFAGDMSRAVRELGRVLVPGGQGILIDYHPFGLYAKKGVGRLRPADSGVSRFEDYYRMLKQSGLRVVDVREAFIDEGMRQFFKEDEIQAYRNLKGTPLLIFLFVYKPKRSTKST